MVEDQKIYDIIDNKGNIMPRHYSGLPRTYKQAKTLVDRLNKNGEHKPYTIVQNLRFK